MFAVKKSLALIFGLGLASLGQATVVNLPEPGYLVIDGAYYGYGLRNGQAGASEARLNSLGIDGFHFDTTLDLGSCTRANGDPISTPALGEAQFRSADSSTPPAEPGLAFGPPTLGSETTVSLVACAAATYLLVNTGDADVSCSAAIGRQVARGSCPALDAADPGFLFFNAFE